MPVSGGIRADCWAFAFILGISPCLDCLPNLNVPDSEFGFQRRAGREQGLLPSLSVLFRIRRAGQAIRRFKQKKSMRCTLHDLAPVSTGARDLTPVSVRLVHVGSEWRGRSRNPENRRYA